MQVFLVGGAVRDVYMRRESQDRDYVVVGSDTEEMLAQGFVQVGASFPVFIHPETGDEYALARTERKIGAGYLGFETRTAGVTLEEDLFRRDFTINSMAIDMDSAELIDPFGGLKDIKERVLRHVGPAFREDPLRVIRMARFLARFPGFDVATETFELVKEMVSNGELNELPFERFAAEIQKVFNTCTPDGCFTFFETLHRLDATKYVKFFEGCDLLKMADCAEVISKTFTPEVKSTIFAATCFNEIDRCTQVGGAMAANTNALLKMVRGGKADTALAYEVLKMSGAWKNADLFSILLSSIGVDTHFHVAHAFTAGELILAMDTTRGFDQLGAKFAAQGMMGAEIGERIRVLKMHALSEMFDLQQS